MSDKVAHFEQVKIKNRKLVRNLLRRKGRQSVGRLAKSSGLTYPTVFSLMKELQEIGQVDVCEETESCGGRPGQQYVINRFYEYGLVLYFSNGYLLGKVIDYVSRDVETICEPVLNSITVEDVLVIINKYHDMYPQIRKMSLGIPGVAIEDNISFLPKYKNLEGTSLVRELKEQFEIECYVENDLNAMVLSEVEEMESFAHIAYIDGCVGVGIALFGKLWKGYQGYAGETEFLCSDITNVKSVLVDNILALTCVLNLPRIYLSGEEPDEDSIHFVKEELEKRLPKERIPQFVLVKDREKLYQEGLISMIVCQWEQTE